jgi:tripartite-type tricarboxylate transporter receptor subunit TctC
MKEADVKFTHVPYRGAPPAVTDLLGGHVDIMFSDAPFFLSYIKDGRLIPLAVGSHERAPSLPDVPTTAELGFSKILASNTYGLFAPAKTPPDVVEKLSRVVLEILAESSTKNAFATQEATTAGQTPDKFAAFVEEDRDRWVPLAKERGVFSQPQ